MTVSKKMTIRQNLPKVVLAWEKFNIGPANTVEFIQPDNNSVVLNRVTGSEKSEINGKLLANGQVFLVNPHGVFFGKTAQVDVGGLVASTLDISNKDFLKGRYQFSRNDRDVEAGDVINQGSINAGNGAGFVALLGGRVSNQGKIAARLGSVALVAGNKLSLDFSGDGLLNVKVYEPAFNALVENHQLIEADGGNVLLTAQATNDLLQTVVNNTGLIQARTVKNRQGRIVLSDGFSGGTVKISGWFDVSAQGKGDGSLLNTSGTHLQIHPDTKVMALKDQGAMGGWRTAAFKLSVVGDEPKRAPAPDTLTYSLEENSVVLQAAGVSVEKGDIEVHTPTRRSYAY